MFRTPPITKNLIIINLLMYFALVVGERWGLDLNNLLGLHFVKASDFHIYQLFTYMFMHANVTHIFFNLFMFWMFGRTMESVWGPRRFLLFYVVCGVGAGFMQEIVQLGTYYVEGMNRFSYVSTTYGNIPMSEYLNLWTTVGASGAIYGILLGFGMTFPHERILLLIPPIPIKAKSMVLVSAVIELLLGMSSQGDNVAHFADLGGMLCGWFLIRYWRNEELRRRSGFTSWEEYRPEKESVINRWKQKVKDFSEQHQHDSSHEPEAPSPQDEARSRRERQEEINRILDKIKRSGYDSLTEEEKRKLFDAGNR